MTLTDSMTPTAICNQALDVASVDFTLGDIQEGTKEARVCLRHYTECLRQLLRGCQWDFARKQAPLLLLADATGQTADVGTVVPGSQFVYEYAWPADCAKVRYIPWNPFLNVGTPTGNITPVDPSAPTVTGLGQQPGMGQRVVPAPYLVTSDINYMPAAVATNPTAYPGKGPTGQNVILCNVQNAQIVYTYDALYPSQWDHQFRAALVIYLASWVALPLAKDKTFGISMQDRIIARTKELVAAARVSNGNEGWYSSDIRVDWMSARITGGSTSWGNAWPGCGAPGFSPLGWGGYDAISFANGSAF